MHTKSIGITSVKERDTMDEDFEPFDEHLEMAYEDRNGYPDVEDAMEEWSENYAMIDEEE
jgi:hypothetical protein